MIGRLKVFLQEVWAEMSKVTWPTRSEVRGSTIVVIITVTLLTVFIGLVDRALSKILSFVFPH